MSDARPAPAILAVRSRSGGRRLLPPTQHVALCERRLVLRSLDVARSGRLTIVIGPPGYGKTTALAQWHARLVDQAVKVAWYSASESEREPAEFLRMLALALEAGGIDPGDAARRAIADGATATALDAIVLGLEQAATPAVIIIDDFERIDHPPVTRLLAELIEALPEDVHLTLAGRRKPTLAVSLLRMQGGVRTIEPDELRLDRAELAAALDLPEDAAELDPIGDQTEGWPVAVQLYRLWRERIGGGAAMPRFGGHASEVADYLAEQVLGALPAAHRQLLSDLSILDIAEASISDHVRDATDSAALLSEVAALLPSLVQQSVLDGEIAYRLHPLLSDYAHGRMLLTPGRAALLHNRASEWLWKQQQFAAAIRHAVQSQDEAGTIARLEQLPFLEIFLAYGVAELRLIMREIPTALATGVPRIRLMNTLILFKSSFYLEAERMRQAIEKDFGSAETESGRRLHRDSAALALLFRIHIDGPSIDYRPMIDRVRALAPQEPLMWSWCDNTLLVIQQQRGDLFQAHQALARARHSYRLSGVIEFAELNLIIHDLIFDLAHGRLRAVQELATAVQRRPPVQRFGEQWQHAMAKIATAAVDYERSFRAQSAEVMRMALVEFGEGEAWYDQYAIALPVMIDVTYRRHGLDEARQEIARLWSTLARRGLYCLEGLIRAVEMTLALRAGALDVALPLAAGCRAAVIAGQAGGVPWRERDWASRALVGLALAQGDSDEAARIAGIMREDGRQGERLGTLVAAHILHARALDHAGQADAADETLREAVRLAYPEAFVAPFAAEGRAIVPLLRRAVGSDQTTLDQRHVAAVLRAIDGERQFAAPDALSDREAEIVAHLAEGASNKLIARRLGLSDNTIKFHLKKVYAKLGVASRKAAVARAQQDR